MRINQGHLMFILASALERQRSLFHELRQEDLLIHFVSPSFWANPCCLFLPFSHTRSQPHRTSIFSSKSHLSKRPVGTEIHFNASGSLLLSIDGAAAVRQALGQLLELLGDSAQARPEQPPRTHFHLHFMCSAALLLNRPRLPSTEEL